MKQKGIEMKQKGIEMKNIFNKVGSFRDRLLGSALATCALVLSSAQAYAMEPGAGGSSNSAGGIADTVSNNVQNIGDLLLSGSFLAGVGFAGAGLFKVKKAADSDGREPYGPGLWRLGVGGALVALPTLTAAMKGTLFGGSDNTKLIAGTANFVTK